MDKPHIKTSHLRVLDSFPHMAYTNNMRLDIECQYCGKEVFPESMHVVIEDRFGYGHFESSIHCNICYKIYQDLIENPVESL